MTKLNNVFLDNIILKKIRSSFSFLDKDFTGEDRLFFENSGGSLRLKEVTNEDAKISAIPDCPERTHDIANFIQSILNKGEEDIRLFFNAKSGNIVTSYTASKFMFEIILKIAEYAKGNNIVTTALEHPSSYDACTIAASKFNKELRVADSNIDSGSVNKESLYKLIDKNTSILSIILTSNITGAMHDIVNIVTNARAINPDIYIIIDAVQYAAHGVLDVDKWGIDAINIAPYKMFGNRGMAYAYISERVSLIRTTDY